MFNLCSFSPQNTFQLLESPSSSVPPSVTEKYRGSAQGSVRRSVRRPVRVIWYIIYSLSSSSTSILYLSFYFPQKQKILRLSAGGRKQSDKYPNHGNERQLREIQTQLQIHTDAKTHTKQCFSIFLFQISTVFKFDKFQYRFGMSRQVWKADFQIRVWQKIQTLNPANPGMALQQGRSLGKLFFLRSSQ